MSRAGRAGAGAGARVGVLLLLVSLASVGTARGDERAVEAEGAVPVAADATANVAGLRHQAVQAALANAAVRTGLEIAALPPDDAAARARVAEVLAGGATGFVVSYRVLEDRGVGPRRVLEDRAVTQEYAVRVEARVDAVRLRRRLAEAGLVAAESGGPALTRFRLVLVDLPSYAVLEKVRAALVQGGGAASAAPVEFRHREATLEVATGRPAPELLAAAKASLAPAGIGLEILPVTAGEPLRARVRSDAPGAPAKASGD